MPERYIIENVSPPAKALENRKVGNCIFSFIIEPDGSVSQVCTILALGYGMDEEAVIVIGKSNNWYSITRDDKPVSTFCRVSIQFFANFNDSSMWVDAKQID